MPNVNLAPLSAQQEAINRRRQLAQALQQQSMAPLDMPQVAGAHVSPVQGWAKIAQALVATLQNRKLDKQQGALDETVAGDRTANAQAFVNAMAPQAQGQSMNVGMAPTQQAPLPSMGGGYEAAPSPVAPQGERSIQLPATMEQKGQRGQMLAALARGLASTDPQVAKYAEIQLQDMMERGKETRSTEARMAEALGERRFRTSEREAGQVFDASQKAPPAITPGSMVLQDGKWTQVGAPKVTAPDETPEEKFINLKLRGAAAQGQLTPQAEQKIRTDARKEWTDAGRENNPALDEMNMRLKELQVEIAEKKLSDAKADPLTATRLNSNFMRISDKYQADPVMAAGRKMETAIKIADQIIANPKTATNQLTALYTFVKILDNYDSTVREGEVALANQTQSYFEKYKNMAARLSEGRVLSPEATKEMALATKRLAETWRDSVQQRKSQYRSQARVGQVGDQFEDYLKGAEGGPAGGSADLGAALDKVFGPAPKAK